MLGYKGSVLDRRTVLGAEERIIPENGAVIKWKSALDCIKVL